jgi:RNA polymerase sigma factor (sigma-70 family)
MHNPTEITELWTAFRKGDKGAFNSLAILFYETMYNYGTKLTRDHTLVEDCIQDLFLDLWRRRQFLGETDHLKFYLLKSLRRKILAERKNQDKWQQQDVELSQAHDFVGEFSIETRMIELESAELHMKKLHQILSDLTKRQREAIYLKFYQEMDNEQIAKMMSISYQSVRNLIHTAIKDLQSAWFTNKD